MATITKAYPEWFRKKALDLVDGGTKVDDVADLLKISRSTIYLWRKTRKRTGSFAPASKWQVGHSNKIVDLEKFEKFALENKDLSAVEMAKTWGEVSPKTIRKYLHKIGFTVKKKLLITKNEMKKSVKNTWKQYLK
jgi:transposase